jgi:hypothetical protein
MIEEEIRALELSLLTPPVRTSAERLHQLVSADFRELGASGKIYGKAEAIAALLAGPPLPASAGSASELSDFHAVEVAPGVALATYRTPRSLRSSIWRREGGAWRIYFHQGTPVG